MAKLKILLNDSLFKQYFLNYLLIFLLPLLILTGILYNILGQHTKKQVISDNTATLNQVYQALDSEFSALEKTADDLSTNAKLNTYYLKDPLYADRAKNELQRYMITNKELIKEIFIYYGQKNILYSHAGTLDREAFTTFKYPKTDLTPAQLVKNLQTKLPLLTRNTCSNPKQEELLQYYVPVTTLDTKLTILFIFDQQKLNAFLAQYQGQPHQDISLYQKGQLLATSAENPKTLTKNHQVISTQKKLASAEIKVRLSKTVLAQKMSNLRLVFAVFSLTSLSLGMVLVFLMSRHSYTPIAKLNDTFEQIVKDDFGSDIEGDLFSEISKHLSNQQKVIQAEFYQHQELLTDIFWDKLIHGVWTTPAEISAEMRNSGFKQHNAATYFIALISTNFSADKLENTKQKTVIIKQLKPEHTNFTTHLVEMPFDEQIAIIFELHHTQKLNLAIQNWLLDILPVKTDVYVSQAKNQLIELNTAYIEALTILEHATVTKSDKQIHFYDAVELNKKTSFDFKQNKILQFTAAIRENSTALIEESLKDLTDSNYLATLPINMRQYYATHLFNSLITLINQQKLPITETIFQQLNQPINPAQLYQPLLTLSREIAVNIANRKSSTTDTHNQVMLSYLQKNFRHHDFSLESFAANFNVSTTFLTKFIKQETGLSFAKMVAQLKMDYIKSELVTTERPIKQIIFDAGYYDVSNFTRKFRELTGLTPSNYRKAKKEVDYAEKIEKTPAI